MKSKNTKSREGKAFELVVEAMTSLLIGTLVVSVIWSLNQMPVNLVV